MSNPYAPPSTREDVPEALSNKDTILRRIGALGPAYLVVNILWRGFSGLRNELGIADSLVGAAFMGIFLYGFLRGGRKFHFWTALFMALSIAVQTYFMNRALAHPEQLTVPLGPHPWLDFTIAVIPHAIALACAAALYFRARARRA